ncbi:MAG: amino acid adenylation domain-containing protein [Acidobacteria bacterium]|nr:amino acid adenylation domain-containing protein [Acidobacteriota bacterium]
MASPTTGVGFRLSPQQGRVWRLGDPWRFRAQCAVRLCGRLDRTALQRALRAVVDHHEILRTAFVTGQEGAPPLQQPVRAALSYGELDLSVVPSHGERACLEELLSWRRRPPFELAAGEVIEARLLAMSPQEHLLFLALPALCCDRLGLRNLVAELAAAYGGDQPAAAQLLQYADFATWQNELVESGEGSREAELWHRQYRAALASPRLPGEREEISALASFVPCALSCPLDRTLAAEAAALADRLGVPLPAVVLAVFAALLGRLTQNGEPVIGVELDGRGYADLRPGIGLFARALPLAFPMADGDRFSHLVEQVAHLLAESAASQEYLDETQGGERRDPASSFLPVLCEIVPPPPALAAAGLGFTFEREQVAADRFRLKLVAQASAAELDCELHYDAAVLAPAEAERLSERLRTLLAHAITNPQSELADLDLLGDAERRRVLVELNRTRVDFGASACLHKLCEEQAARTPDAVAVIAGGESLSFRQLDRRANQLARLLQRRRVGPETPVGLCMERSLELMVGLLGILKAGGAYLPLDPTYPRQRLEGMLADAFGAGGGLVLAQPGLVASLPEAYAGEPGRLVLLDAGWEALAGESEAPPPCAAGPDHMAYVIFTSGSTGRPKGAVNTHRAICNRLLWMQQTYGLAADDRVLQKTPFGFDVSVWELFWPLLTGASLVMAAPEMHRDSSYLQAMIREQGITTVHFVPSLLRAFLETEGVERCTSLRRVLCSGEALPYALQERFFARFDGPGGPLLHNLYGPTEAAVDVTFWECARQAGAGQVVPIGRPVANTEIYLLDAPLRPVPLGVPGELYIGGVQVGRGYLGRPELTAERFLPDPFAERPGARLYRSGDLVRHLPDGSLDFLGRLDHQVKIRGFRIELKEIEAALVQSPTVREAVVVSREQPDGEHRLLAYVVPAAEPADATLPAGELRRFLQERLPEYMVPARFIGLAKLPLSANGKLDRRALPAPDDARPELGNRYVAPRNDGERRLAAIWAQLLGVRQVGIEDDFFSLGGDSILAVQVVARAREAGMVLTPMQLFQQPTIAALMAVAAPIAPALTAPAAGPVPVAEAMAAVDLSQVRLDTPQLEAILRQVGTRRP